MLRTCLIATAIALLGAPIAAAQLPPVVPPKAAPPAVTIPPLPTPPAISPDAATSPEGYTYKDAFPPEIPGLGFAMSKQAFVDIITEKKLTPVTNTAKTMFLVQPPGAPYTSIVYFFDSNAGPILTEMEVRFADATRAKAWFDAKFPVNTRRYAGDEYYANDGVHAYSVDAWCNQTKVFIVSTMQNTRWANRK